uniref:Uncharacterized protein n=1 Tax=Lepeophtheirus salmonis TaxID=72036 RepID=A0A0K2VFE9_LEPSM
MKLIHYIAFVQILVLVVDFCSATHSPSKFDGNWCEDKASRSKISDVMRILGLSDELIKKYEEGNPMKLDIVYNPTKKDYIFNGTDSIGLPINWTIQRTQRERKVEHIFGKDFYFSTSFSSLYLKRLYYRNIKEVNSFFKFKFYKFNRINHLKMAWIPAKKYHTDAFTIFKDCSTTS